MGSFLTSSKHQLCSWNAFSSQDLCCPGSRTGKLAKTVVHIPAWTSQRASGSPDPTQLYMEVYTVIVALAGIAAVAVLGRVKPARSEIQA
jgi:hypothetical protein